MAKSDAERARDYRARRRDERDASKRAALADAEAHAGSVMVDAVEASVAAAKWISPSDGAMVAQARRVARIVDIAEHAGDVARELSAHGRLTSLLSALGLTPVKRMAHELRSRKIEEARAENAPNVAENVTAIRPPKRPRA